MLRTSLSNFGFETFNSNVRHVFLDKLKKRKKQMLKKKKDKSNII